MSNLKWGEGKLGKVILHTFRNNVLLIDLRKLRKEELKSKVRE